MVIKACNKNHLHRVTCTYKICHMTTFFPPKNQALIVSHHCHTMTELSLQVKTEIYVAYKSIINGTNNETVADLCGRFGVSRNVPSRLAAKFDSGGSLESKKRPGRPKNSRPRRKFLEVVRENRKISGRKLSARLNISGYMAQKMLKELKFKRCCRIARPPLSAVNISKRLNFCKHKRRLPYKIAFLDEKMFMCRRESKSGYYRPSSPPPFYHPPQEPPKMMFVAVIAGSVKDGKVGIWPVGRLQTYKNNSKYHNRGDTYWQNLSCNGQFFCELLDNEILPTCERFGIRKIQMDNAKPHVVGTEINSVAEIFKKHPTVKLIYQPPQSPDTNPLDEGIFKSLADSVELRNPKNRDELVHAVFESWCELSPNLIRKTVNFQLHIRKCIVNQKGGNRSVKKSL